jgi:hypothetical protein
MRADVLQTVALCSHGNSFLAGLEGDTPIELVGHNRAFRGVEEILFERIPQSYKNANPIPVAGGTGPWLRRLLHEGIERLELRLTKCSLDVAKSGPWGITTDGDIGLELWQPSAKARMVTYGEPLIWRAKFTAERIQRWTLGPHLELESACALLRKSLAEADSFAQEFGSPEIRSILMKASQCLAGECGEANAFPDLLPIQMPGEARRIVSAAVTSMLVISSGTWNRENLAKLGAISRFDTLSQLVWKCSMSAFEASVNSWRPNAAELRKAG